MASVWIHTIAVEGKSTFPADMLRYDVCAPATSQDVDEIFHNEKPYQGGRVALNRFGPRNWVPTSDRWASFGWRVVEHHKRAWG